MFSLSFVDSFAACYTEIRLEICQNNEEKYIVQMQVSLKLYRKVIPTDFCIDRSSECFERCLADLIFTSFSNLSRLY